jgi:hypothetical protein
MGCQTTHDASAHTSYLIMLLKSGPRKYRADRPLYRPGPAGQRLKAFYLGLSAPRPGKRVAHYTGLFRGVNGLAEQPPDYFQPGYFLHIPRGNPPVYPGSAAAAHCRFQGIRGGFEHGDP